MSATCVPWYVPPTNTPPCAEQYSWSCVRRWAPCLRRRRWPFSAMVDHLRNARLVFASLLQEFCQKTTAPRTPTRALVPKADFKGDTHVSPSSPPTQCRTGKPHTQSSNHWPFACRRKGALHPKVSAGVSCANTTQWGRPKRPRRSANHLRWTALQRLLVSQLCSRWPRGSIAHSLSLSILVLHYGSFFVKSLGELPASDPWTTAPQNDLFPAPLLVNLLPLHVVVQGGSKCHNAAYSFSSRDPPVLCPKMATAASPRALPLFRGPFQRVGPRRRRCRTHPDSPMPGAIALAGAMLRDPWGVDGTMSHHRVTHDWGVDGTMSHHRVTHDRVPPDSCSIGRHCI